ncbi:MAG: 50S ribosomal protein L11 methyltransferase [Anaerolineales bacterium]|nr:50S ribosomal protein L11 methyltransferase [Anaerolineales bacterium]
MRWLEISFTLTGELAEPVADLLARYTSQGIVIESTSINDDEGIDPVLLRAYLPEDETLLEKRSAIEEGIWHLGQISEIPPPQMKFIEEQEWEHTWKAHYKPIRLGERLLIIPAWEPVMEPGRLPILIDPGMAFGTGTHPTTQLCLIALENYVIPGQHVLDIGCGSGILSIAAVRLGASRVLAVDLDAMAVKHTIENAERNQVAEYITARQGPINELLNEKPEGLVPAPLVVANILAKTLIDLLEHGLSETLCSEGILILSGILDHQVEAVQETCENQDLRMIELLEMNDWRALIARKIPPTR